MAYSKDLVTQLTKQIVEDIDGEVRQLVLDAEKHKVKRGKALSFCSGAACCIEDFK